MLLSTSVEIRQSETASRPTIRRSRICMFTQPPSLSDRIADITDGPSRAISGPLPSQLQRSYLTQIGNGSVRGSRCWQLGFSLRQGSLLYCFRSVDASVRRSLVRVES